MARGKFSGHESGAPDHEIVGLEADDAPIVDAAPRTMVELDAMGAIAEEPFLDVAPHAAWMPPLVATQPLDERPAVNDERMPTQLRPDDRDEMRFDERTRLESLDPLSDRLGDHIYRTNASFDWCRHGMYRIGGPNGEDTRPKHVFTRNYVRVGGGVLVDLFTHGGPAVQREVAEKTAAIGARNAVSVHPIGYLPVVRGCFVPDVVLEEARTGGIMPLQTDRASLGVPA